MSPDAGVVQPSVASLAAYFLRLGAVGFGGPAALAERMQKDLVETRRWIAPAEFRLGLTIAAACPGPLAYQLAVFCGFIRHGHRGAWSVAVAFALAPFMLVVLLAAGYGLWNESWIARALFFGASPVIVVLIARASWGLGRRTLHRSSMAWSLAAGSSVLTWASGQEPFWLFILAAVLGVAFLQPPDAPRDGVTAPFDRPKTGAAPIGVFLASAATGTPSQLFWFFCKTGCLVFGSGLVIVPFLRSAVVDGAHWITPQQFLDSVTIGLLSPGPVVITATFVGYLVDRLPGALAATTGMFLPAVLFTIIATPWFMRHRSSRRLTGLVRGITAAVVGVLAGTVPIVARAAVPTFSAAGILIAASALIAIRKIPDPALIALGAAAGLLAYR